MATYKTTYYVASLQQQEVRAAWMDLEKGKDMSYFQSYNWYMSILPYQLKDNWLHENLFVVVEKNGLPALIAPLTIVKHNWLHYNQKGVYLMGRNGWSDYLNFIYRDFDGEAVEALFSDIKEKFGINDWFFEQLKESSALCSYIIDRKTVLGDFKKVCVALELPESEDEYLACLSKSVRQNIRTARNRLAKDGKVLRFVLDDKDIDKQKLEALRAGRLGKKNYEPNIIKRCKSWMKELLKFHYPDYLPFYVDKESHVMVAYEGAEAKAFFNYGLDKPRQNIVLMAVGTDESFARYSPGMLLMLEFIKEQISLKEMNVVDFTRGNEFYKYALGGKDHFIFYGHVKI